jgi:nitroreductase
MREQPSVEQIIRTRRSVRSFAAGAVEPEKLSRVLELATRAPSANNVQPWHFVVVEDESRRRDLARLTTGQMWIAEAPVIVACCGQRYLDRWSWLAEKMYLVDTTIAIDHLTLAARAEGLGTCWVGAFDDQGHAGMKKLLGIPDGLDIVALIPMGYPADCDRAFQDTTRRKPVEAAISQERYEGD